MKKLSIVLPTYNEKENLEDFVREIFLAAKVLPNWTVDVVVTDSNSPDGTGKIAEKLAAKNKHIHHLNVERGLGVGLIKGHSFAVDNLKPDILVQMDADGQVDATILSRLVSEIESGYNLVLGSRLIKNGKNNLPLLRKIFTLGSSWFCRIFIGPFDIREFTNSTRAFTPELYKKINLERLPWREKTFIVEPAFLHEAVLAGAKYIEIPLIFKDREEGYSKNKVLNYAYDVITYGLEVKLHSWGLNVALFAGARRIKTLFKFALVGLGGTVLDFTFYNLFINYLLLRPATAKGFSTEVAIVNNFFLNNFWTFKHRNTATSLWQKMVIFNVVSLGGLIISVLIVKFLHSVYGDGVANILGLNVPFYNIYFFVTIPPVMIWNFLINHFITWRSK